MQPITKTVNRLNQAVKEHNQQQTEEHERRRQLTQLLEDCVTQILRVDLLVVGKAADNWEKDRKPALSRVSVFPCKVRMTNGLENKRTFGIPPTSIGSTEHWTGSSADCPVAEYGILGQRMRTQVFS